MAEASRKDPPEITWREIDLTMIIVVIAFIVGFVAVARWAVGRCRQGV